MNGFSLAEILVTLGIIGFVAALTIPSLVTKITNKGYVERLFKTYSVLQNATNMIVAEEGDPVNWSWEKFNSDRDHSKNNYIVDMYRKYLKVSNSCDFWMSSDIETECYVLPAKYKYLNGETNAKNTSKYIMFYFSAPLILADGTTVAISFKDTWNSFFWASPDILFTIDVNGKKGPNQIGRDVFFVYMNKTEHGKLRPYTDETFPSGQIDYRNTCSVNDTGYSCAYRIFQERKMNY